MNDHTTNDPAQEIPYGYCHCGCGQKTRILKHNDKSHGYVKGRPLKFINHHYIFYRSLSDAFWSRVTKGAPEDCWEWKGIRNIKGYGQFPYGRKLHSAHRVSYEIHNGPIPEDMCVLHRCDNPPCCNPAHLWLGTQQDNTRDRDKKGRQVAPRGEKHGNAKLTETLVLEIRRLHKEGMTQYAIAKRYNLVRQMIWRVVHHKSWKHVL